MNQHPKIYVAGHRGMVGSTIVRQLLAQGQPAERIVTRRQVHDDRLRRKPEVDGIC
jgi:GDP-L-fucose synthase